VIALISVLLYLTFSSVKLALLVVGNVPFALVGAIAALWIRGMNLNLSASIGFVALFGVAMLNGVVLVSFISQLSKGRGRVTPCSGSAPKAAARANDCFRRQLRVHPHGYGDFEGS
jgi:Cu/Ag efflux pump CusA